MWTEAGPGRPKGSSNIRTKQWDNLGKFICEEGTDRFMKAIKELPDDKYIDKFMATLEYFMPKLSRVDNQGEVEHNVNLTWK